MEDSSAETEGRFARNSGELGHTETLVVLEVMRAPRRPCDAILFALKVYGNKVYSFGIMSFNLLTL